MHSQRAAPELFQGTELFVNIPGISAAEKELAIAAAIAGGADLISCGVTFIDMATTKCLVCWKLSILPLLMGVFRAFLDRLSAFVPCMNVQLAVSLIWSY